MKYVLPAAYLGFAVYMWIDFVRMNPDGLANLGLMFAALPVTLLGLALTWALGRTDFVLLPDGLGYYAAHAVYYWPSVLIVTLLLYWLATIWSRKRYPP